MLDNTNALQPDRALSVRMRKAARSGPSFTQSTSRSSASRTASVLPAVELEFSWRHDQYSDVKGTSNPKVAFNWAPIEDFTIRGTWGTSFRAPVFGEFSPLANVAIAGQNLGDSARSSRHDPAGCAVGVDLPPVGSGAWKVQELVPATARRAARRCLRSPSLRIVQPRPASP